MTTRREAELETENRMLREQVTDLKAVIEQISRPGVHYPYVYYPSNWAAGYPWYNTWYGNIQAGGGGAVATPLSSAAGASGTLTMNVPSPGNFS